MRIESIKIKNYRTFKEAILDDLPALCVFVGANGTGKSTLFDIFSFLKDALTHDVTRALNRRGGFKEVISRGEEGNISLEIAFRESGGRKATYDLTIGLKDGKPVVVREILKMRRGARGQPWHILDFEFGRGQAIINQDATLQGSQADREEEELESPDLLAISSLGKLKKFPVVADFRRLIDNWHISNIHINTMRQSPEDGISEHLSTSGDNLANVAQYLNDQKPEVFQQILKTMEQRVPGVSKIDAKNTEDGRLVLRFQDGAFKEPFIAKYVSDGTLKMFAYLVLLYDPAPFPMLAIEEPENQLYPHLMMALAEEFRQYARREGQIFISSHSPDFLNAVSPDELYCLKKDGGFTTIVKASENPLLLSLYKEGDLMGALWSQGLFNGVNRV